MSLVTTYLNALTKTLKRNLFLFTALFCGFMMSFAQTDERNQIKERILRLKAKKDFSPKDSVYIDQLNDLGKQMRYYNVDSVLILAQQALHWSNEIDYKKGKGIALLRLGDYYSDRGEKNKSITYYSKSSDIAKEINNSALVLRTMNNLAGEYVYKGDYAKALNGFLEAIEMAELADDKKMQSIINENIANLYASQKDYAQSLEFYQKVKKINNEIGNDVYSAETMSNLASVYADMGELDYAMFNINKSISVFEKNSILDWLAFAYEIKGKVYLKQGKYKWALYWYDKSDLLHRNLDDDRSKIDLLNGMAEAYLGQGKDDISKKYALEAFDISNEIEFLEGIQKCSRTLCSIASAFCAIPRARSPSVALPGCETTVAIPSASQRSISPRNDANDCANRAGSGVARLIR
jgi:tetratricopeptide (TPR) repeat protein